MKRTAPGAEMPFLDHLEELRWRLVRVLAALAIGIGVGFALALSFHLIDVLAKPVTDVFPGHSLVYTHPIDPINAYMTLSLAVGLILSSPVILYQVWAFVAPALFPNEKRVAQQVLLGGLVLFLLGVAMSYFLVVPMTLRLGKALGGEALVPMLTISEYFSFITMLALTFGAAFELPILVMALGALGIVTPPFLRKFRRHAFVACVIAAAVITPGDAVSATLFLMLPLYCLYELGILLAARAYKWRQRRDAADETPDDSAVDQSGGREVRGLA